MSPLVILQNNIHCRISQDLLEDVLRPTVSYYHTKHQLHICTGVQTALSSLALTVIHPLSASQTFEQHFMRYLANTTPTQRGSRWDA